MTERAASELIGFVLVFAIVTMTIGTVYAAGLQNLADASEAEQTENMVRAFDVLDDNLEDIHRRGASSRATEIKLPGGSIGFGDSVRITVDVTDTANSSHNDSFSISTEPIVYESEDGIRVVYTAGTLLWSDGEESVIRSPPPFRPDGDRAVAPLLLTHRKVNTSTFGGRTTILVVAERTNSGLAGDPDTGLGDFQPEPGGDARVNLTVASPRADAWDAYFDAENYTAVDADPSDGNVTYQFTTDRLFVPRTTMVIEIKK